MQVRLTLFVRLGILLGLLGSGPLFAVEVVDDAQVRVQLAQPAQRIISLAPHVTELLFSAGLGDKIVGTVAFSNYPEAAKKIPQVGAYNNFDYEKIKILKPDLIVGWLSGNPAEKVAHLKTLGFTLFLSEPRNFAQLASNVQRLAELGQSQAQAAPVIAQFHQTIADLARDTPSQSKVSVFYEIWDKPLMTLNGEHLFSQVLQLCGGQNVFAQLPALAPTLSEEAVLAADPEVILASGMDAERPAWLDKWQQWPQLQAVRKQQLFFIAPDLLQRPSLRIALGAQQLCSVLTKVRRDAKQPQRVLSNPAPQ